MSRRAGEAVFAARNAIDGQKAANDHGKWPWTSWGINRDPNAAMTVAFGRKVVIDEVVFLRPRRLPARRLVRGGHPWSSPTAARKRMTPDGRPAPARASRFAPRAVEWVRLERLIKKQDQPEVPRRSRR